MDPKLCSAPEVAMPFLYSGLEGSRRVGRRLGRAGLGRKKGEREERRGKEMGGAQDKKRVGGEESREKKGPTKTVTAPVHTHTPTIGNGPGTK